VRLDSLSPVQVIPSLGSGNHNAEIECFYGRDKLHLSNTNYNNNNKLRHNGKVLLEHEAVPE
jgi:hypothetical protein